MTLVEFKTLLENGKCKRSGTACKKAIDKMIEKTEKKVLAGEQVELMVITHKNSGIVYLLCNAQSVRCNQFVCVSLDGSETKLYAKSTLMEMFSLQMIPFQQLKLTQKLQ